MATSLRFNNLKIAASEQAPRICQGALGVSRHRRLQERHAVQRRAPPARLDVGPLMVANERIHQTNASLLLIAKDV